MSFADREAYLENSLQGLTTAHSNVLKENDTLRQQLDEAQAQCKKLEQELDAFDKSENSFMRKAIELEAMVEASRKQEAVAFLEMKYEGGHEYLAETFEGAFNSFPVYATPVIAPDVLEDAERYRWLISDKADADIQELKQSRLVHAAWDKVLDCGGNYTKDEIDDSIDAAIGDVND